MEKLKPCPFCGGAVDATDVALNDDNLWSVICGGCGASSELCYEIETAYAAWNRRADTVKAARCVVSADGSVTCSECGMPFVMTGARFCPMCGARLLDLIVTSKAPDGAETVEIITEEQLRKSREAFENGQKTIFIPRIETRKDVTQ